MTGLERVSEKVIPLGWVGMQPVKLDQRHAHACFGQDLPQSPCQAMAAGLDALDERHVDLAAIGLADSRDYRTGPIVVAESPRPVGVDSRPQDRLLHPPAGCRRTLLRKIDGPSAPTPRRTIS